MHVNIAVYFLEGDRIPAAAVWPDVYRFFKAYIK